MKKSGKESVDSAALLLAKAEQDKAFRACLLANPRRTIERELGIVLDEGYQIHVHEESRTDTHLVLPPPSPYSAAEREEAKSGSQSLAFLHRTMYDPAPPLRSPAVAQTATRSGTGSSQALAEAGRAGIRRGLDFLESILDERGAWHCIRFNTADADIPRHYERPAFVSAYCILALASCSEAQAQALCATTRTYLAETAEYPGLWRYYRHLPPDLDSTALCSLALGGHPWIALGRNLPPFLANRDKAGRFLTWVLGQNEPEVVSTFRIEADPVVNANVIAYLGDCEETIEARQWLEDLVVNDSLAGTSKWYPDLSAIYHAIARAVRYTRPALDRLRPILADRLLALRDEKADFGNVLQTAQAVTALWTVGGLEKSDAKILMTSVLSWQQQDGSWPELLAFGDQEVKWGMFGQIGHGSESVTTAFCIEALECLIKVLKA